MFYPLTHPLRCGLKNSARCAGCISHTRYTSFSATKFSDTQGSRAPSKLEKLTSQIRVRLANLDDISAAMSFAAHAATAANWSHKQYVAAFSDAEYHLCLVVEDHGEVMGFAVARMLPDEWEVENIAVAGTARRRGLATRLMGELMERARAADAKQIFLEVRERNHAARALYEKWAFEPAGRRKSYYQNPIEDAIIYRFSFPQAPKSN